jgi:hypothetical protein
MAMVIIETDKQPNIIEATTVQEANKVNMGLYRFERYSEHKGCYIFVKRSRG